MYQGVSRNGPQYLEDLATGYWFSEVLFTAVELEIFTLIDKGGRSADEISGVRYFEPGGMARFLHALCAMGLLVSDGKRYYNTQISSEYLVIGKENYQGNSILWRKHLVSGWQDLTKCLTSGGRVNYSSAQEDSGERLSRIGNYITAMDRVARTKVKEILPLFEDITLKGKILDVGTGSGAVAEGFLKCYPEMTATLMDLQEVLDYTGEVTLDQEIKDRVTFCPANILEEWPVDTGGYELIILSNIIHAYSEKEIQDILKKASDSLKPGGFILIHDFFMEHYPEKAALFDLNMFINTYNGKVFSYKWVIEELSRLNLFNSELIPLKTDTALIISTKNAKKLAKLNINPVDRLISTVKKLDFDAVSPILTEIVHVPDWVNSKCRFGCDRYGKPHCPPNSMPSPKTRDLLKDYSSALLLKGQPPTREFQILALQAEKEAFKAGFHKALVFWAGPCSLCKSCTEDGICRNTRDSRPSMEAAGIDVFETVRRAGFQLDTLKDKHDFVTYFALLLLE